MIAIKIEEYKKCKKCGISKLMDDYYNEDTSRDGKRSECKPCYSAARELRRLVREGRITPTEAGKTLTAFCDSDECRDAHRKATGKRISSNEPGVVKEVKSKHETWCPDCESALFWKFV